MNLIRKSFAVLNTSLLTKETIHHLLLQLKNDNIISYITYVMRKKCNGGYKMIHHYKNISPKIHDSVFIAKNATIIGDVTIDEDSSIWFKTVIRGDVAPTRIGKRV